MAVRLAVVLGAALALALVAGCDLLGDDTLPGDRAVELALREVGDRVEAVVSADLVTFRQAGLDGVGGIAGDRLVWVVVLAGSFEGSCGPVPKPGNPPRECPPPATRATVVLDGRTGEFLVSSATR